MYMLFVCHYSELSSNTDNTAAVCHQADVWIDLDEFEATFR